MAKSPTPLKRGGERAASSASSSSRSGRWQGVFMKKAHITYSPTPRSGKWWQHLVADSEERQLVAALARKPRSKRRCRRVSLYVLTRRESIP